MLLPHPFGRPSTSAASVADRLAANPTLPRLLHQQSAGSTTWTVTASACIPSRGWLGAKAALASLPAFARQRVVDGSEAAPGGTASLQITIAGPPPSRAGCQAAHRTFAYRQGTEIVPRPSPLRSPAALRHSPGAAARLGTFGHTRSPVRHACAAVLKHRLIPAVFEHPAAQPLWTSRLT